MNKNKGGEERGGQGPGWGQGQERQKGKDPINQERKQAQNHKKAT